MGTFLAETVLMTFMPPFRLRRIPERIHFLGVKTTFVILLTGIVVLSGFIGRYIYTSVPRTADGLIVAASTLQDKITTLESELKLRWNLHSEHTPAPNLIAVTSGSSFFGGRVNSTWKDFLRSKRTSKLPARDRAIADEIQRMQRQKRELQRQVKNLALARKALSAWHKVHIPLGMAMFTAAVIHIGAALYYSTLLR